MKAIAATAGVQRGLVHRRQLDAAEWTRSGIDRLIAGGVLHPVLPRVYAVGHDELLPWAPELAVALFLQHDAVMSHGSAARLWGFGAGGESLEATIIGRDCRPRPGLETHRVPMLDLRDVRLHHGIPVTAPARTLIDVAGAESGRVFERGLAEARVLGLVSDREMERAMERAPYRPGVARMRTVLDAETGGAMTRSEAERMLLELVHDAGLPAPRTNVSVNGYEVDFLWEGQKLIVEMDGFAFHAHHRAFERDRRRDQALVAAGYRVIRVTWRQLIDDRIGVAVRIAQALSTAG